MAVCTYFTACGSSDSKSTSDKAASTTANNTSTSVTTVASQPEITLTYRGSDPGPVPGIQNNDIMNEIAKELGIKINYIVWDPTKDKVALASGDLPDIMQISNSELGTYIKGDHIIPLDDLLSKNGHGHFK